MPARTDVLFFPNGSQAMPSRGAKLLVAVLPTLLPNGELFPFTMIPFSGFAFGLRVPPPAQGAVLQIFPLASMVGALVGSYSSGSKLVRQCLPSLGCLKSE